MFHRSYLRRCCLFDVLLLNETEIQSAVSKKKKNSFLIETFLWIYQIFILLS